MSDSGFAILDPSAGISGDMLLGALVSAGAPKAWLGGLPARLGLDGVEVGVEEVDRCGIQAVKVTVRTADGRVEGPEGEAAPGRGGGPQGHHPHRHVGQLIATIERAPLSPWVRERATRAFQLLGEAEGRVHGMPAERVSLHEVGAVDALVDIVGCVEGFEQLGVHRVFSRPVALGSGWVEAAHGMLPVPAPATAILLEGHLVATGGPVEGEATTPTGAVLLRVLSEGQPPAGWRPVRSGWGAGSRNPRGYPNALRLILAEAVEEAAEVVVVQADIDDLSPEYLAPLREGLFEAGALDVQMWSTLMKKGRIGFRIEALAEPGREAAVANAFFTHSSTAGVRWYRTRRATLARRHVVVEDEAGNRIRVKVLEGPAGASVKPEYEDVIAAARQSGRPVREIAEAAGRKARAALPGFGPEHSIAHKESQ